MKKIIFRADGNSETGLGHLYRLFALVEIYKERFEFIFLTKESTTYNIIPDNYHYKIIPNYISISEEPEWINDHYPSSEYMIIADGYQFIYTYQKQLKTLGYKLFYIDDLAKEQMVADVVINHSLNICPNDYKKESYTQLALGAKYAILRPGFLEAAKRKRIINKIETAFVCFGGSDPYNLTVKATEALLKISRIKKINVVLGAAYMPQQIFEIKKKYPQVKIHQNISELELINTMSECDFAVAPSSNILYELCAVKMPILSGYYVENQKNIYAGCIKNNIIFDGGNFVNYSVADFENKINQVLSEQEYQKWLEAQSMLFDSKIKERFLELIPVITYRRANSDDMMILFNWTNDPVTRANSYSSEPVLLENHKVWFEKKIKDKNSIIYIAEIENKPVGMIRYDVNDNVALVGISVDKNFRGKGYASDFLSGSAKLYFEISDKPILAYIKCENKASIKSFEKANYKMIREEAVNEFQSFVYQLKKE